MFTKAEATAERVASYLEALEAEKEQLGIALAQEKEAGNDARVTRLESRLRANGKELERVQKLEGGKSTSSQRKPAAAGGGRSRSKPASADDSGGGKPNG